MGREPLIMLSPSEHRALERLLSETRDAHNYRRILSVLRLARGDSPEHVAETLSVAVASIYRWAERYNSRRRADDLCDRQRSGRPPKLDAHAEARLRGLLTKTPESFGYQSHSWTVALLRSHLAAHDGISVSQETLRRRLHQMNFRWKRPKHVYSTTDPHKGQKKGGSFQH